MWRFIIAMMLVAVCSSIGLGRLFDSLQSLPNQSVAETEQQLLGSQALLLQTMLISLPETAWLQLLSKSSAQVPGFTYAVVDLASYPLPATLQAKLNAQSPLILETAEQLQAYLPLPEQQVLLVSADKALASQPPSLLLTLAFYGGVSLLMLLFLMPFVRRLRKLNQAATQFGKGQLGSRVAVGSVWYLNTLETAFNTMATQIESLLEDIKLLANGLSHELRTPLTRVRMGLDTLAVTTDPAVRQRFEQNVNVNLDTMESLLNELLSFSRLQYSLFNTAKMPVDINSVLRQLAPQYNSEIVLFSYSQSPCVIAADPIYCKLLISNLLDNARKYARHQVLVVTHHTGNTVQLFVRDDGMGIKTADRQKIFQPFVRLPNQPHHEKAGYGIGLALVARIAFWLNANVELDQCEQLGGAKFLVSFPPFDHSNQ